ncbi:MAG: glycosyltransferase family 2 protein [Nocardioidaceae bacterium]
MTVAALLVSHGGAAWLPAVLEGIAAQTVPVDVRVAVDTGSKDESPQLITDAWGQDALHTAPRSTSYGEAVQIGLDATDSDWVWLLHDDANPAPTALEELLAAAREHPEADIFGPKLREWPSLKRLLELGITITGTGRRETGLERGEYDQGQHDDQRRVLAVNTAGMLVRRWVLDELGGFDRELPIFGNDLDFGWRAALAGRHTVIVPQAVVFHAEAAHRGLRQTPLTGRHTHFQERRSALFTLLANSPSRFLLWRTIRLAFGTFWRVIGFLLVRSVGEALDELAALLSIYTHPGQIAAARRKRRDLVTVDREEVKPLLAPGWLPYRHGLDFLSDLAAAVTLQAQDVAERRRAAKIEAEGGPVRRVQEEDELAEDSGIVVRFLTNPVAVLLALFVVAALIGSRAAWGHVSGAGLSPAPLAASSWWSTYVEHWHALLNGTDVPAPAYLLPLAVGGSLLGGNAPLLVSLVLVLAVPVALWGAWRFLRVAGHLRSAEGASRWVLAWGSVVFALVPITSGAWGEGRLGTVVTTALLPWIAHAALGFGDPEPDRRWRAGWRTGLLLSLATAFTPALWLVALVVAVVVLSLALGISPAAVRQRSVVGPPLVAVGLGVLLLLPWVLPLLLQGRPGGLLLEAGRLPAAAISRWDLLTGVAAADPAPFYLGAVVAALAVLALLPRGPRLLVTGAWIIAVVAIGVALLLSLVSIPVPGGSARPGLGVLVVVVQGAFITAVVLAGEELTHQLSGALRRLVGAAGVVLLGAMVLAGTGWFVLGGDPSLTTEADDTVPAYMVDSSLEGSQHGVLILRGTVADGLGYTIRRGDGTTLGEDEIEALTPEDTGFTDDVRTLVARPTASASGALSDAGIEYVVLAAPADPQVAATLDATAGLSQASASDRSTRAWHVDRELARDAVAGPGSVLRTILVVAQLAGLVLVLVLCGPTLTRRRPR